MTETAPLACIVLAAGSGTRMKSSLPKVLHPIANQPMIAHVLAACAALKPQQIVVVTAPGAKAVEDAVAPYHFATQEKPLGTGDAVKAARTALKDFTGDVLVLTGDTPLITAQALQILRDKRRESEAAIIVGGFTPPEAGAYGRLVIGPNGMLSAIVEAAEATPEQKALRLCNGGIILFDSAQLWPLLDQLRDDNSKREFYLTDTIKLANAAGLPCAVAEVPVEAVLGINNRVELAEAEQLMQQRLRRQAMLDGVTMTDPETVYLSADTKIGRDTVIGPNVVIGPGVVIGEGVQLRAFCHLEQVKIEAGALIGPFARLRPGTLVGVGAHIGNFVELKNTELGAGAKVNHLSYIGDATIGPKANLGAGTITCNYDGFRKHHTHVGEGAFVGSNSALVAPVSVGDGAYIGAGSVITMEVPAHTLAVARGRQANIPDWARRYREEQEKGKK